METNPVRFNPIGPIGKVETVQVRRLAQGRFPVAVTLGMEVADQDNIGRCVDRCLALDIQ